MNEPVSMEDVVAGARLLAFGLRPKQIPSRDVDYADLVKRAVEDDVFRTTHPGTPALPPGRTPSALRACRRWCPTPRRGKQRHLRLSADGAP